MKTFLETRSLRRKEGGLLLEIQAGGDLLVPYFENLTGKKAESVTPLSAGEYWQVSATRFETENMVVDWIGVGMSERIYTKHLVWGQSATETLPTLRFNRATDHISEFFTADEPFKYGVLFRLTTEGLRFVAVERLVEGKECKRWQECDLDTSYIMIMAMHEILPRLAQKGE